MVRKRILQIATILLDVLALSALFLPMVLLGLHHGLIPIYAVQLEAMGGRTGTNCDEISTTRGGVRAGLISVPQRNMHTPAEVCDFEDMENIAKLIAAYITDKEAQPNA